VLQSEVNDKMLFSNLGVPGPVSFSFIPGVEKLKGEQVYSLNDYKGKFLVILFYQADWECQDMLISFSKMKNKFSSTGCELVACSTDNTKVHKCWMKTTLEDGGLGDCLEFPLWSDTSGDLATRFDLFDPEEHQCLNGLVIIDDSGLVRHGMTTSLNTDDTATNCLDLVKALKVYTDNDTSKMQTKPVAKVEIEKDWDISRDPELIKALEVAKRLGQTRPAHMVYRPKNPTFDLPPTRIRRMVNPRASVKSCSAAVYRNLAGFGSGGDISKNQKLTIENIMKKVLGVAFMPEELAGEYKSLSGMTPRELNECFESEVFTWSGDTWARDTSLVWQPGTGVFVNNYENFLVWVNRDDQLKIVSTAKGQDLKYVLLRLHKAVIKIEEAIKSCQGDGFTASNSGFAHTQICVNGTGLEVNFNIQLPGFVQAGRAELDKTKADLNASFVNQGRGEFTVGLRQVGDISEHEIVTKSVEMVDAVWKQDQQLQSKLGVKLAI